MISHVKSFVLTFFCVFILFGNVNLVSSATTSEIETLFNLAENQFPELFPNHRATQMIDPWAFRFYPSTGIYAGVKNNEVFVLGGPWGTDSPTFIDTLSNLLIELQSSGGNGGVPACSNIAETPAGMVITQSGNVVNITTNGQCIPLPENTNFCEPPRQSQPTGVSVLSNINITSSQTTGITIDQPGIPNPLSSLAQGFSSCTINAPLENQVISMDACFDITNQLSNIPSGFGVTVNPPVTFKMVGTTTTQVVADCFTTDAAIVSDAFTGESWAKVNGNFVSLGF